MDGAEEPVRDYTPVVEGCFACGTANPASLKLRPYREGEKIVAEFTPQKLHRGYSNVVHGGIVCAALDEVMGAAVGLTVADFTATVEIRVRYRRPFFVETPVRIEGWVERVEGRKATSGGRILDQAGEVLAEAEATFVTLPPEKLSRFTAKPEGRPNAT